MIKTYNQLPNGAIQFEIESLEPPTSSLDESPIQDIVEQVCPKLEAISNRQQSLVNGGQHAFLWGLHRAYADHRPFVLSPDMIWLLIVQGVAQHFNAIADQRPDWLPTQRTTIRVQNDKIILGDPNSPWEETTTQLTDAIEQYLGNDFVQLLRADFSTTQLSERVASEITILDALKPYFKYVVFYCICGIPSITLEGTADDWAHMLQKMETLKQYDLAWWMDELIPIVKNIHQSATGQISKEFWMTIFKVHTEESYGAPKRIDGWITRFFPYDRKGNRFDVSQHSHFMVEEIFEQLPSQIVQVPFLYEIQDMDGSILQSHRMEYWAGFVGLKQDSTTFELRPKIDWWVARASDKVTKAGREEEQHAEGSAYYNITEIPQEIFEQKHWSHLELHFHGTPDFPNQLKDIQINALVITGKMTWFKKRRLLKLLSKQKTYIQWNDKTIKTR